MARKITLKYPAECKDCGAALPAGSKARYYGKGRVYGVGCHPDTRETRDKPPTVARGGVLLSELGTMSDERVQQAAEDHVEGGADFQFELLHPLG